MIKKIIAPLSINNILKIVLVGLILFSGVGEARATPADDACKSPKVVGDTCSFQDASTTKTGNCARGWGITNISGVYCETDSSKWGDCNGNNSNAIGDKCKTADNKDGICKAKGPDGSPTGSECKSIDPKGDCDALKCDEKIPAQFCKVDTNGQAACSPTDACGGCSGATPRCQIEDDTGTGKCVADTDYKCTPKPCPGDKPHCIVKSGENTGTCSSANIPAPDTSNPNDPNNPEPTIEYVEFKNPIRFNNLIELLGGITNALLTLLGVIAVLVIMASGFKYMTSSNPGEVSQAVGGIKNAVIGIAVIMGAYLIINYVISALL